MLIQPGDANKFPKLVQFITEKLIMLPRKDPQTYEHFRLSAGISSKKLDMASYFIFLPGTFPYITFENILDRYHRLNYGYFHRSRPNKIILDTLMAGKFESHSDNQKGQLLVIAKTLHEFVHWARDFFSTRYGRLVDPEGPNEFGNVFETTAYGKVIQMLDSEWK